MAGPSVRLVPRFPPPLGPEEIRRAVARPLGGVPLRAMAGGRRRALILVEDASRPARTGPLIEILLRELSLARPRPERLDLLFAGGAHLGMAGACLRDKLPRVPGLPVHHHDARAAAVHLGRAAGGIPVALNPLVVEADLRIGVGTVNFHPAAGFSGGAKLVLPGAAALETIAAHHALPVGTRGAAQTPWRTALQEAADRFAPLDFLCAMLADPHGGLVGLWAGEPRSCEEEARRALRHFALLPRPAPADLCLVGTAPFDRSLLGFFKAFDLCLDLLAPGGTGIIYGRCPEGAGQHLWRWSEEVIRRTDETAAVRLRDRRIYLVAPGVAEEEAARLLPRGVVHLPGWEALPGPRRIERACVVPYGPLTAFADETEAGGCRRTGGRGFERSRLPAWISIEE